jgi:hypothetical protein
VRVTEDRPFASGQRSLEVFQAAHLYQPRQRPTLSSQAHYTPGDISLDPQKLA